MHQSLSERFACRSPKVKEMLREASGDDKDREGDKDHVCPHDEIPAMCE